MSSVEQMRPYAFSRYFVRFFLVLGIALAVLGLLNPVFLIIGASWIAVALGLGALFRWLNNRVDRRLALRHAGAPGTATVLRAEATNMRRGGGPSPPRVYKMHLRIEADGMEPYELETNLVPDVGMSGLQPGREWPVFVDRTDREHILVDWDALRASGHTVTLGPGVTIHSQDPIQTIAAPAPEAADQSLGDQMLVLHRLKDAGLIPADEFERQRARLVDSHTDRRETQ